MIYAHTATCYVGYAVTCSLGEIQAHVITLDWLVACCADTGAQARSDGMLRYAAVYNVRSTELINCLKSFAVK